MCTQSWYFRTWGLNWPRWIACSILFINVRMELVNTATIAYMCTGVSHSYFANFGKVLANDWQTIGKNGKNGKGLPKAWQWIGKHRRRAILHKPLGILIWEPFCGLICYNLCLYLLWLFQLCLSIRCIAWCLYKWDICELKQLEPTDW